MKIREFLGNQNLFPCFLAFFFLSFSPFSYPLPTALQKKEIKPSLEEKPTEDGSSEQALRMGLEGMAQTKTPLELHNLALRLLKDQKKSQAVLLLKQNSYRNLFPPSILALYQLNIPLFFPLFLWHMGFFLIACFCLPLLFLSIKKLFPSRLKALSMGLSFLALSLLTHSVFFKKRVESLKTEELRSAPFPSAPLQGKIQPGEELTILSENKAWFRVEGANKTKGWIQKQRVFQIF